MIERIVCSLVLWLVAACAQPTQEPSAPPTPAVLHVEHRSMMTTTVSVHVSAPESPEVPAAIRAAFAEIDRVAGILNEWKPGTEISEVNTNAGVRAVPVSPEVFAVVETAMEISQRSQGAFDITVGALWGAWDFSWKTPRIPQPEYLRGRVKKIDYRRMVLDREAKTLRLQEEGMLMSLGGIAKGYAVDRASQVLKERGFPNHLVVAGGDLYASGRKPSGRWAVGIRHPGGDDLYGSIEIEDAGLATSGNYERFFVRDGVRYHHILDPKTGYPARGLASTTVIAPSATLADAYATAVFVAGPDAGLQLAQSLPDIEALLFTETTFEVRGTPAILQNVTVRAPGGALPQDTVHVGTPPPEPR